MKNQSKKNPTIKDLILNMGKEILNINKEILSMKKEMKDGFSEVNGRLDILEKDVKAIKNTPTMQWELKQII